MYWLSRESVRDVSVARSRSREYADIIHLSVSVSFRVSFSVHFYEQIRAVAVIL